MRVQHGFSRRTALAASLGLSRIAAGETGIAPPERYLKPLLAELRKPWPKNRTVNIVCHGHSVPAGYFRTPVVRALDAYPHLLRAALSESYPIAVINVIVTAVGGEHSESGAQRFERDVLGKQPDVVLIDYGLNDRAIGLDRAAEAWSRMVTQLAGRGIPALLLTPTADNTTNFGDSSQSLGQHARQIRELASRQGVGLADSFAAFEQYVTSGGRLEDLLSQSNHPNRRGHELVAARVSRYFWSAESLTIG
ncbi:SGNH/GDSL hydrolase family protein [uncultured Paludibaculum sp.]|uniref:SGNH/GDSL hydrolase family protein n=1 Tax=uncultured Paludibaculum sp. TaxID=1765020 RepID=UPI002AAA7296|nr:SGNH/GDSL hydrolase family protein [uncultured Paludibaculum sp.]